MTGIFQGANALDDLKLGTSQVAAAYQGANLLWPTSITEMPLVLESNGDSVSGKYTLPVGIEDGDLIVVHDFSSSGTSTPSSITPAGFTTVMNYALSAGATTQRRRSMFHYKVAVGGESGEEIDVMLLDNFGETVVGVFRPNGPINSVGAGTFNAYATDGNPPNQNVLADGSVGDAVLSLGWGRAGTAPGTDLSTKTGTIAVSINEKINFQIDFVMATANYVASAPDDGLANLLCSGVLTINAP